LAPQKGVPPEKVDSGLGGKGEAFAEGTGKRAGKLGSLPLLGVGIQIFPKKKKPLRNVPMV